MATQGQVTKIYDLRTLGFSEIKNELNTVNDLFEKIKRTKLSAQGKLTAAQDINDIKKYAEEVAKLQVEEQRLRTERQRLMNDQKAANILRQQELEAQRKAAAGNAAEAGSIRALRNEIKELNAAIINRTQGGDVNFRGQTIQYDQAIAKLKELTTAEQNFRRQFAQDGLLVAEYSSGIVQAFKQLGLDDLIGGQITKGQQRIQELNTEFNRLQQELSETRVTGEGSLQGIEKQLIDNRKEVIALTKSVDQLNNEYRGTGDVGNQITKSLSNGFKELRSSLGSFVVQFIGFQALFNKITSEVSEGIVDVKQIEGVEAAFGRLNDPNLLANLRAATRGTVSDLKLMQITVQATNFQIPQEQLGFLLDFARRRAKETGQEVDFLVQSIVTGIGRKSPLILDNLGISAVRLREKLKGIAEENANVGDVAAAVAEIIKEENAKAGAEIDTQSEKIAQNEATWRNLRLEFAQNLLPVLTTVGSVVLFLISNLSTLGVIVAVLAVGWGVANAQLLIQNTQLAYYNLLIIRNYIALGILSTVQLAYNAALVVGNTVLRGITAAMRLFGITTAAATGPLGIILTLAALFGTALLGLSKVMGSYNDAIDENTRKQRALIDINRAASNIYTEQIGKIDSLRAIIRSTATSIDTKRKAVQDLIAIDNEFSTVMKKNIIDLNELEKAYTKVTTAIRLKARVEATAKLAAERQAAVDQVAIIRQRIQSEFVRQSSQRGFNGVITINDQFSKEDRDLLTGGLFGNQFTKSVSTLRSTGSGIQFLADDFKNFINQLDQVEVARIKALEDYLNFSVDSQNDLNNFLDKQGKSTVAFEVNIKKLRDDIEKLDKEINDFQGNEKDLQTKIAERKKLQAELERLTGTGNKTSTDRGSRLTGAQKDAFKDIDALRDQQLAEERKKRLENTTTEEVFLNNILRINTEAINKKLAVIKGANAEERKQIAELNLEKITNEQETNKKLFDIRVEDRRAALEQTIRDANTAANVVANDPLATNTQIAQARLDADKKILAAQEQFAADLDRLEKELSQQSLQNAKQSADEIVKTKQQLADDEKKIREATLEDIRLDSEKEISQINIDFAKVRAAILANDRLTASQRTQQLERLNKLQAFTILTAELKRLTEEFKLIEKQYADGLINEEKYLKAKAALEEAYNKQQEAKRDLGKTGNILLPSSQTSQNLLRDQLSKSFGFETGSAEEQLLGNVLTQTYSLATEAMNSYFDAEEERIRRSLDLQLQRLDREKELVLGRAQSQAEIESIERQYAQKKRQAEKEAGEQLKKSKKAEARISLATELANIAVSAAANPANGVTFGAAGAIMYGVLAALALGKYQLRINDINNQQFERGGDVPTRGGEFGGKPHSQGGTPFGFQGRTYEAEVGEMSVIRTKNAPRNKVFNIVGTQRQIASALNQIGGGISFAKGASVKKFEFGGNLGESLQAPVFLPQNNTTFLSGNDPELLNEIKEMRRDMQTMAIEQSNRIDRLEVVQVTSSVTRAQKKEVQQSEIATL